MDEEKREETRKNMMGAPIRMIRSSRDAWEKPRKRAGISRYQEGDGRRFSMTRVMKTIRGMKYRKAVPRGSATKETWQLLMDDVDEFSDLILHLWNARDPSQAMASGGRCADRETERDKWMRGS